MKNSFRDQIVIYCYDIMNLTNLRKTKDVRLKTNFEEGKTIFLDKIKIQIDHVAGWSWCEEEQIIKIYEYIDKADWDKYDKLMNKIDLLIDLDDCTLGE